MANVTFPKNVITRAERYDFTDDGTRFRGYLYKNVLPITYARWNDEIFLSIRLDYLMSYEDYQSFPNRGTILDYFNGARAASYNKEEFVANCEKAYQYYINFNSTEAKIERTTKALNKAVEMKTKYEEDIARLTKELEMLKAA